MKILTRYHGETEIDIKNILHFSKGIPAFPDENEFILMALPEQDLFTIMQSVKTPELAFVLTNPFSYIENYEIILDEVTIEQLSIKKNEDVSIFSIVTVKEPFQETTANFQAPIIINLKNNEAKQIILNDTSYDIRHPLFAKKIKE